MPSKPVTANTTMMPFDELATLGRTKNSSAIAPKEHPNEAMWGKRRKYETVAVKALKSRVSDNRR